MSEAGLRSLGVLVNTFEGTDANFAGGHVHTFEVISRLHDLDVVVFAPGYARAVVDRLVPGARFVAMPSLAASTEKSALLFLHRAVTSLRRLRELRQCDGVYATSPALPDILPAALAKPGRVTICIFHVLPVPWKRGGPLLRNAVAFVAEAFGLAIAAIACRSVIVGTEHVARQLRRRGFRQPMFVTTNGVVRDAASQSVRRPRSAVFVGRLHPSKGLEDLVRAWGIVRSAIPDATLTVVGNGPAAYRTELQALARLAKVEQAVRFAGRVENDERSQILATSSIFVFPSYEEGWGIAIAEAMAAGLPCVTYRLPVYREVFPSGSIAVPTGDVPGFADAIVALFEDDERRLKLAREAVSLARSFSWDRAVAVEREAFARAMSC